MSTQYIYLQVFRLRYLNLSTSHIRDANRDISHLIYQRVLVSVQNTNVALKRS